MGVSRHRPEARGAFMPMRSGLNPLGRGAVRRPPFLQRQISSPAGRTPYLPSSYLGRYRAKKGSFSVSNVLPTNLRTVTSAMGLGSSPSNMVQSP